MLSMKMIMIKDMRGHMFARQIRKHLMRMRIYTFDTTVNIDIEKGEALNTAQNAF